VAVRVFICLIQYCAETPLSPRAGLCSTTFSACGTTVEDNLQHAYPHLSAMQRRLLARRMWEHLALMLCEIALASRKIHRTNWRNHITIHQKPLLVAMLMDPRPRVVLTGHFGNFEMLGFIAGLLGFPTFTIARPLDNRLLTHSQPPRATGQYILPTRRAETARRVLDAGETLALLAISMRGQAAGSTFSAAPRRATRRRPVLAGQPGSAGRPVCHAHDGPMRFGWSRAIADPADDTCQRTVLS
jgi:KDO2-lipid IV(A) lauroyltransferase